MQGQLVPANVAGSLAQPAVCWSCPPCQLNLLALLLLLLLACTCRFWNVRGWRSSSWRCVPWQPRRSDLCLAQRACKLSDVARQQSP